MVKGKDATGGVSLENCDRGQVLLTKSSASRSLYAKYGVRCPNLELLKEPS